MSGGDTVGELDRGWWASNAPTGGYLLRLALEAAASSVDKIEDVRALTVHVLRPAVPGAFRATAVLVGGSEGASSLAVTFSQADPFAIAHVVVSPRRGPSSEGDLMPPAAMAATFYEPMSPSSGASPPVMSQFVYRPTIDPKGVVPRTGWDVVWIRATGNTELLGHALVASIIDCWFPAFHARTIRNYLAGRAPELIEPPSTTLVSAQLAFTAALSDYNDLRDVLVANQLCSVGDGNYFERAEVWSEQGLLLATGNVIRRNEGPHDAP